MIGWWHKRFYTLLKRTSRDNSGVAAIEFAIAFPIYLLFFLNLMEVGLIMFGNAMVNNMVSQAARASMIGCVNGEITSTDGGNGNVTRTCTSGSYTAARLKDEIQKASLGLVKANDSSLFTYSAGKLDDIDVAGGEVMPAAGSMDLGDSEDIIVFHATYKWPIFNPASIVRELFGNLIEFQTATMIRNEPYGSLNR